LPIKIHQKLAHKLDEKLEFYKGWLANPKKVGAIAPTSTAMARIMASVIRTDSGMKVLELGPGSGVTTKAILDHGVEPENLISIEFTESFLPGLRQRYPGVHFIHEDAFNIAKISKDLGIERFDAIISALPLLNFPITQRLRYIKMMLDHLEPGRPLVQFSYGLNPPVPERPKLYSVNQLDTVLLNLPPARIWTYQRSPDVTRKSQLNSLKNQSEQTTSADL